MIDIKDYYEDHCQPIYTVLDKDKNNKRDLYVLYSGGYDSTYLLKYLLEYVKSNSLDCKINTISFVSGQLGASKLESSNRKGFIKYCKDNDLKIGKNIEIDIDQKVDIVLGNGACPQPAIWLYNIMAYLPADSIVFTGYIHGDDFLTFSVFNSWFKSYEGLNMLFGKNIDIYFPLAYTNKDEIISHVKHYGIEEFTSYCESSSVKGETCGYCASCLKHKAYSMLIEEKVALNKENEIALESITLDKETPYTRTWSNSECEGELRIEL